MKKFGFTLAEVLITLGVVGVVAALTIPTLIRNAQERATIGQVKEAYAILSTAYTSAVKDNGSPETWGMAWNTYMNFIKPYLSLAKDCSDGSTGCFPSGVNYVCMNPTFCSIGILDSLGWQKLKLSNGMLITGALDSVTCANVMGSTPALANECGRYLMDVNGEKGPNKDGVDVFWFFFTKTGVYPVGTAQQTGWRTFSSDCKVVNSNNTGSGCAAWLMYNENMDYLHCSNLDWGVKTTCN